MYCIVLYLYIFLQRYLKLVVSEKLVVDIKTELSNFKLSYFQTYFNDYT